MADRRIHHPLVSDGARLGLRVPRREPSRRGRPSRAGTARRTSPAQRHDVVAVAEDHVSGDVVARCPARGHSGSGRSTAKSSTLGRHAFVCCPAGSITSRRGSPRLTGAGRAVRVAGLLRRSSVTTWPPVYSCPTVRSENLVCTGLWFQVPMIDSPGRRRDKGDRGMVRCTAARSGDRPTVGLVL
jgi:hypothetical protein